MKDTSLYQRILGIEDPWEVSNVHLDIEKEEIEVILLYKASKGNCPVCNAECSIHDYREQRRWRHLDSCQMKTYLVSSVPRVKCSRHGVKTVALPWASPSSRYSELFERLAIDLLLATKNQSKTAGFLRISFAQLHLIMEKAVLRGLTRRGQGEFTHLGIDEKSMKKGHKYITVLSNLDNPGVIDVEEDRSSASAKSLLEKNIPPHKRAAVEAIAMDMWQAYMDAANSVLPEADIVHDRFHIMKHLNDSVDKTRRRESEELNKEGNQSLKNSRYLFLKNQENMTDKQQSRFQEIQELNLKTCQAWRIKENFKEFFSCQTLNEAKYFFAEWFEDVRGTAIEQMIQVSETLLSHANGLLNYIIHRITNSVSEWLNGKIQEIKIIARGFRKFKNYRIAILFFLGNLELYP
jgi:transposase